MSRPIGEILKENAVLVAGIALPVLLVIVFAIAKAVPAKTVPDPLYKAVIAVHPYNNGYNFAFKVKDGKPTVTYTVPKEEYNYTSGQPTKVLIYDPATDSAETITLEKPEVPKDKTTVDVPVPRLESLKVTDGGKSPDGYEFVHESYGSGSFVTDIFGYNRHRTPNSIRKDGRIIPIGPLKDVYYNDITFVGWVTP